MDFDYVIVGAGSAGCVLANRLTEDGKTTVALAEAGGRDTNFMIHMPIGYGKIAQEPGLSWHYFSQPEPHINSRRMLIPRGKGLGGSSSINGLIYIRGQAEDFNSWSNLGAIGWSWQDVLPYFRKSQSHEFGASNLRGGSGPLYVQGPREQDPTSEAILRGFIETGTPETDDFNGEDQWGAGFYHSTIRDGRRCSAAVGYLRPAEKRPNLKIITGAHVRKILLEAKRAIGIELKKGSSVQMVKARREVILSAGAYHSPQLLQLSGIGPANHLRSLGIEVLADSREVGANLQDHLVIPMAWRVRDGVFSYNRELRGGKLGLNVLRYLMTRKGPMTLPAAQVGAFVKSDPALDRPDIQFHCLSVTGDLEAAARSEKGALSKDPGFTLGPCQLRPESRGHVKISRSDAHEIPDIVHNYLEAEKDRQIAIASMKIARAVAASPSVARLVELEEQPGSSATSDDDLLAFARAFGMTGYHPVGTCRMGSDETAVVDPALRVKGVDGLRVIDASIMPRLVSGNTNAATIMIAEKAADQILGRVL